MSHELACARAQGYGLSPELQRLMNTYWYMDHHEFEYAYQEMMKSMPYLEWKSEIVLGFYLHGYIDHALKLLRLYRLTPETLDEATHHIDIFLENGYLTDAFESYRNYGSHEGSSQLLIGILRKCFANPEPSRIQLLLELPFDCRETKLIRNFCIDSEERLAHYFIIIYQIYRGQYSDAVDLYSLLSPKWGKYDPNDLLDVMLNMLKRILAFGGKLWSIDQTVLHSKNHDRMCNLATPRSKLFY
jgi:hypothetical protein